MNRNKKIDRKVNKIVKKFNKQLAQDVYKDRFYIKQYKKSIHDDIHYYMYELCDNLQPNRNLIIGWYTSFDILTFNNIAIQMNNFIVDSDFWLKERGNENEISNN